MKIDIHCHALGNGMDINNTEKDIYFNVEDNPHWLTRILYDMVEKDLKKNGADFNRDGKISTDEYFELLYRLLVTAEEIDGIVLLGLDAVYSPETGKLNKQKTDLWVSNVFLNDKISALNERLRSESDPSRKKKRFFLGASVSPNRKKWEDELEYVLKKTDAVLVKWIPSVQHINVNDERHKEFYNALANNNMPLLCHVGPEYSFPEGIHKKHLDNFRFLETPLKYGVTVIAAHCAAPVFPLIDKNKIKEFHALMKDANGDGTVRLWADTSALSLSTRIPLLPEIRKLFPPQWLIHGSDFPIPIEGWPHGPWVTTDMTLEEYTEILKVENPFDRDVMIKRAHGFSDSILENAEKEEVLLTPAT